MGNELYISEQDATVRERASHHLVVLAKNYKGWLKLIEATSASNNKEFFYYKPRLDLERLADYCGDLISFSGHPGSQLGNLVFKDNSAYSSNNPASMVRPDAVNVVGKQALYLQEIFGKGNFFIEIQLIDKDVFKPAGVIGEILREVSTKFNIPCVATADSHYPTQADAVDQRVLLCSSLKTTFSKVMNSIGTASEFGLSGFFKSNNYHIPSYGEMAVAHTEEEIQNANDISEMCENYDILSAPRMPQFECPAGMSQPEYMKALCRKGWVDKLHTFGVVKDDIAKEKYRDRFLHEFGVIEKAGLSGYFLVVQDYVNWAKKQGWLMGMGRGCLTPDAKIFNENGVLVNISECKDQKVITRDGSIKNVNKVFKYSVDEKVKRIYTYYGDSNGITMTLDHKVLCEKTTKYVSTGKNRKIEYPSGNNIIWEECNNVEVDDYLIVPIPNVEEKHEDITDLSMFSKNDNEHDDKKCFHRYTNPLTKTVKNLREYNRYITKNEDFYRILGLFAGDGWLVKSQEHVIGFAFHSEDNIESLQFVEKYFKDLGIYTKRANHKTKRLIQLNVRCLHFARLIKSLFINYDLTSDTKHVPQCVITENKKYVKSFLLGYLDSDGHINGNRYKFETVSKTLHDQIRFLLLRLGRPCSSSFDDRKDPRGYSRKISYAIRCPAFGVKNNYFKVVGNNILLRVRKTETIDYTGDVYDLNVGSEEKDHNFLTSNFLVHNSSAGSLVSYLLGITNIDPIPHDLLFSRFYNEGRNTADRVSLPDIDIDCPVEKRGQIIDYLKRKYGENNVTQISTFGRLQGKSALKEVLRVHEACGFDMMNQMTKFIPQEHEIADLMKDSGETSILNWALENDPQHFQDWCRKEDDGTLVGEFSQYFEQAIRIEGTYKSVGKHAAGVVISTENLNKVCPMVKEKKGSDKIAALEMNDLEAMGHVKFDLLGLACLEKLMGVNQLLKNGCFDE